MLRSLPFAGVLILGGLTAFNASAQRYDDGQYRPDPRYDDGQYRPGNPQNENGPAYDYARVVRVDPIIVGGDQGRGERCYERSDVDYVQGNNGNGYRNDGYVDRGYDNGSYQRGGNESGRQIATVIGGLAGAVLGSRIGGGRWPLHRYGGRHPCRRCRRACHLRCQQSHPAVPPRRCAGVRAKRLRQRERAG